MRVLHLTTHLNIGGITTYILRLTKPLAKLGVETFVVSSGGECTSDFEKAGATCFTLPIKTKSEAHPKIYFALPHLKKIIQENHIDVLHAHTRITQVMAYWMGKKLGIPVVTTCHGFFKNRFGRRLIPAWGDRVIAISQGVADHLANDFKVPALMIQTINNAVDIEELDAAYKAKDPRASRSAFGFTPEDFVIGIVARLVADKGHDYLIQALNKIKDEYPRVRLLIVGDGRQKSVLQKLTSDLGLSGKVIFAGNVKDVTGPMSAMDIFALPAIWREGFGLSIVEAMACKKVVIVSNIWALNTLVQNQITGVLIEPKSVDMLAEAIIYLYRNPEKSAAIGQRARKMVEDYFCISRMAQELLRAYESVQRNSLTALGRGL